MDKVYLMIGFLGSIESFKEFVNENNVIIESAYITRQDATIILYDGTIIRHIPFNLEMTRGYKVDQIIVTTEYNIIEVRELVYSITEASTVPMECRILRYGGK